MMYERALQKRCYSVVSHTSAKKDVIQSNYTLEMYKLYEFTMPLTAKAKNLLLIIQNVILLKIDILAKTYLLYCITLL